MIKRNDYRFEVEHEISLLEAYPRPWGTLVVDHLWPDFADFSRMHHGLFQSSSDFVFTRAIRDQI